MYSLSATLLVPQDPTNYCARIPFFLEGIKAGFPSPAESYTEKRLDLNELLIKNPISTFFLRVSGDSMEGAGIDDGDILIVDRSVKVKDKDIVIAELSGEFTVKRIKLGKVITLIPENPKYQVIEIKECDELVIFGVVTTVIKLVKR